MTPQEIDKINALEHSHWWYRGTREICIDLIRRALPPRPVRILDLGCGTGGNMQVLAKFGPVEGVDVDPRCIEWCREKGLAVREGSMLDLELPPGAYDVITVFDVLNQAHPSQMPRVLSSIRAGLAEGGLLAIREPALAMAAGRHDLEVNIKKRFDRPFMMQLFRKSGFELVSITYLNTLLFIPIVATRKLHALVSTSAKSDVQATVGPINALLLSVLRLERWLLRFTSLPFGVSLFAIARRVEP